MNTSTTTPRRIPIVPRVQLPEVPAAMRELLDELRGKAATEKAEREAFAIKRLESLFATGKHVYPQTVPATEIRRRRAAGKRAKLARRAGR